MEAAKSTFQENNQIHTGQHTEENNSQINEQQSHWVSSTGVLWNTCIVFCNMTKQNEMFSTISTVSCCTASETPKRQKKPWSIKFNRSETNQRPSIKVVKILTVEHEREDNDNATGSTQRCILVVMFLRKTLAWSILHKISAH